MSSDVQRIIDLENLVLEMVHEIETDNAMRIATPHLHDYCGTLHVNLLSLVRALELRYGFRRG